jgi:hypothetical protein
MGLLNELPSVLTSPIMDQNKITLLNQKLVEPKDNDDNIKKKHLVENGQLEWMIKQR